MRSILDVNYSQVCIVMQMLCSSKCKDSLNPEWKGESYTLAVHSRWNLWFFPQKSTLFNILFSLKIWITWISLKQKQNSDFWPKTDQSGHKYCKFESWIVIIQAKNAFVEKLSFQLADWNQIIHNTKCFRYGILKKIRHT